MACLTSLTASLPERPWRSPHLSIREGNTMIDTTLSSFERDVIEASLEVPTIVDFWAPWCGPCKMLGPLLEKLEHEYGGRLKLVNVNSHMNPELGAPFNPKSIPHPAPFLDGTPGPHFPAPPPPPLFPPPSHRPTPP